MVKTKTQAYDFINNMSEDEFVLLCEVLNKGFKRQLAEKKFVAEINAAEESVASGNYVTSAELHEFLGV